LEVGRSVANDLLGFWKGRPCQGRDYFSAAQSGRFIFQGAASVPGVFRIDHDQAFQRTTNLRYQHKNDGLWGSFVWRYDSGLVVTGVPDSAAAMTLTGWQQVDIGLPAMGCSPLWKTRCVPAWAP
jgi:hypothetical protein